MSSLLLYKIDVCFFFFIFCLLLGFILLTASFWKISLLLYSRPSSRFHSPHNKFFGKYFFFFIFFVNLHKCLLIDLSVVLLVAIISRTKFHTIIIQSIFHNSKDFEIYVIQIGESNKISLGGYKHSFIKVE